MSGAASEKYTECKRIRKNKKSEKKHYIPVHKRRCKAYKYNPLDGRISLNATTASDAERKIATNCIKATSKFTSTSK